MEARLQELLDKQEIREGLMLYCRGVDRRDRELIENTFHPDALDYGGGPKGKAMADQMLAMAPSDPCYTHFIGNQMIELDGDRATSEAYFISVSEQAKDGQWYTRIRGGRYIDRLRRHEGRGEGDHRA